MKQKLEYPSFLYDSTETDGRLEVVMDYVISWCLRFAETRYCESKPILNQYCKYMLAKLLETDLCEIDSIDSVQVWKEWENIDLTVEVELTKGGHTEHHAILIEDKYYSNTHKVPGPEGEKQNQLEAYKKRFDSHYKNDSIGYRLHYNLITCVDREDPKFAQYDNVGSFGFSLFSAKELLDPTLDGMATESDIFNEFWFDNNEPKGSLSYEDCSCQLTMDNQYDDSPLQLKDDESENKNIKHCSVRFTIDVKADPEDFLTKLLHFFNENYNDIYPDRDVYWDIDPLE